LKRESFLPPEYLLLTTFFWIWLRKRTRWCHVRWALPGWAVVVPPWLLVA